MFLRCPVLSSSCERDDKHVGGKDIEIESQRQYKYNSYRQASVGHHDMVPGIKTSKQHSEPKGTVYGY